MDFKTIVVNVGKNPELTSQAGKILSLVLVENAELLFSEKPEKPLKGDKLLKKKEIKKLLEDFKANLTAAGIIPAESDITLIDLYEKIVSPVRLNIVE